MIQCERDDCPNDWFHYDCVGLKRAPTGKWVCKDCAKESGHMEAKK